MSARLTILTAFVAVLLSPALASAQAGKRYALLVGVRSYDHESLPDLKHTENDVEELAKVLRTDARFDSVVVLTTTRGKDKSDLVPNAKNIREQMKKLIEKVTKRDLLLIGLAGHGLQLEISDPATKKEKTESFFCPTDAKPRNRRELAELKKTMIPLLELFKELEESGAGVKLILVDACRNEIKSDSGSRAFDVNILPRPARGVGALFSCKSGERAFETAKLGKGHGVFFHYVIEGMKSEAKNKRGEVTWSRLTEYVTEKVADNVPKLIGDGARQTPHEMKNFEGKSPILVPMSIRDWFETGLKYELGKGVTKDDREAVKWYRKAADGGHAGAMYALAWRYYLGVTLPKDDKEAALWYRKSAERDHHDSMNALAWLYERGVGVEQNYKEAIKWYRLAIAKGNLLAPVNLGLMYQNGNGVNKDHKEALKLYRQSADKANPDGMHYLAALLQLGNEQEIAESAQWYRKAADVGYVQSIVNLAAQYESGQGVKKDDKEAASWYLKAAEKKHVASMYTIGLRYREARGVARNDKEALRWFQEASKHDHAAAMNWVGVLVELGEGTEKNVPEALKWYRKAADKGELNAQTNLGVILLLGRGVNKDEAEAKKWFEKASNQNFARAMYFLGWMAATGQGVKQDLTVAETWYRKSAAQGYQPARDELAKMTKK